MPAIKADEVKGVKRESPFERTIKILASPETESAPMQRFSFGMTIFPPSSKSDRHGHEGTEEILYILAGQGEIEVAGEKMKVGTHMIIPILPGQEHQVSNTGDDVMKTLWVMAPPGAEKYIYEKRLLGEKTQLSHVI